MINNLIQSKNISDVLVYTVNEDNCMTLKSDYNLSLFSFISDLKFEITKKFLNILSEKLNTYVNPLIIFYLYNLDPKEKERDIKIKERELAIIDFLVKQGFYIIVCTENKIRQYNRNFYDTERTGEED